MAAVEGSTGSAATPDEVRGLAKFVGRLYLLLISVVYDHPRWLPRALRNEYRAALAEVYPSVWELQRQLLETGTGDDRAALARRQRLARAGLSGAQLKLKLHAFERAEARFYGRRTGSGFRPDRVFAGEGEEWQLQEPEGNRNRGCAR
jgi:hypothetical protein